MDELNVAIAQEFSRASRVVVVSHLRPDGDAIGSALGLGLALQAQGKTVEIVFADGIPSSFRHLPTSNQVKRVASQEPALLVVVDCSDMLRTGGVLGDRVPDINIDHHVTNEQFARYNYVLPEAVATSAILAAMLPAWGLVINRDVAACLLTGLVSDTLGFRTSNMTSEALRLAADLMDLGADLPTLYMRALVQRSLVATRYWGQALDRLEHSNGMVWTSMTLQDRLRVGYSGKDDADLINVLSSIDEAEIALIFIQQNKEQVKVSWRSVPGIDVSQIAVQFGGGGHPAASGAMINGTMESVQQRVLEATRTLLANSNRNVKPQGIAED
ncbi:MAG TPA: bifunctional oligoribonuclease/PAP phosphatase NrnA [Anaerolineaceae bacterium]|nr:bifunctional oligoribonuclease/PAP phosphatase NrnA [Anaerolineaceae bacterium]